MTLSIVHAFRSAIPDDPVALAGGEICPQSHWNATHTLNGTVPLSQIDMLPSQTVMGNASNTLAPPTALTSVQLQQILGGGGGGGTGGAAIVSATAPASPTSGLLWGNTTRQILQWWDGTTWRGHGTDLDFNVAGEQNTGILATNGAPVYQQVFNLNLPVAGGTAMTAHHINGLIEVLAHESRLYVPNSLPSSNPGGVNAWTSFPYINDITGAGVITADYWIDTQNIVVISTFDLSAALAFVVIKYVRS